MISKRVLRRIFRSGQIGSSLYIIVKYDMDTLSFEVQVLAIEEKTTTIKSLSPTDRLKTIFRRAVLYDQNEIVTVVKILRTTTD